MKYRKKPIVIDAVACESREKIETLEGVMIAEPGDYIITGVKGERYPCRKDIFDMTYERVEEEIIEIDEHGKVHGPKELIDKFSASRKSGVRG
jgi:hypothetical protein